MPEVMYDSQVKQRIRARGKVPADRRRVLHKAAIACIIEDGRSFNDFRKKGMKKFLDAICPG